jgi:hypothetical protein
MEAYGGEEVQTHLVCFQRTVDTERELQLVYLHENIFGYLSVIILIKMDRVFG